MLRGLPSFSLFLFFALPRMRGKRARDGIRHDGFRQFGFGAVGSSTSQSAQPPSLASAASSSSRFGPTLSMGIGAGAACPPSRPTFTSSVPATVELQAILSVQLRPGEVMKIRAVAGSGKSTALREYAGAHPQPTLYLAFNKAVQRDQQAKLAAAGLSAQRWPRRAAIPAPLATLLC